MFGQKDDHDDNGRATQLMFEHVCGQKEASNGWEVAEKIKEDLGRLWVEGRHHKGFRRSSIRTDASAHAFFGYRQTSTGSRRGILDKGSSCEVCCCSVVLVRCVAPSGQAEVTGAISLEQTLAQVLVVGNIFEDRRQPGHLEPTTGGAASHCPPDARAPIPPGDPLDDSPALDRLARDTTAREK